MSEDPTYLNAGELTSSDIGREVKVQSLTSSVTGVLGGVWHRKSYGNSVPKVTQVEIVSGKNTFTLEMKPIETLEVITK